MSHREGDREKRSSLEGGFVMRYYLPRERLRGHHGCGKINWKGMKGERVKSEIREPQKRKGHGP